jgi:pSer/pThr/pTyr-binding forkhead associated (FHA) protein
MPRLLLKFDSRILREIPVGSRPLTIGRAPDNDVPIDNLAVSDHHARLYTEGDRLVIEDLGSLNGTYVNDARIERTMLRDGDTILIGKHQLLLDSSHDAEVPAGGGIRKAPVPKLIETAVLDTEAQRDLLRQTSAAAPGAAAGAGVRKPSAVTTQRLRTATLRVLRGRTDKHEYVLAGKLTVIGCSEMASVRLLGWFAPQVAGHINRRDDGYYLGLGDRIPRVNGQPIHGPTRLRDGDVIGLGRVRLLFSSTE